MKDIVSDNTAISAANKNEAIILIIDDDADTRKHVSNSLIQNQGWQVHGESNGSQVLDAIRRLSPSIILLNAMEQAMNGFQLLKELKANAATTGIPIILLSANAGEQATIEGLDKGANDYLVKPFSALELTTRIKTQLEVTRTRQGFSKLSAAEERARISVEFAELGTFEIDAITGHLIASPRMAAIFDLNAEAQRGSYVAAILPEDRDRRRLAYARAYETGNLEYEGRIRLRDPGTVRWVKIKGKVMYDGDNRPLRILGVVQDITAQKEAERQKDEFLSIASHELKTPLTTIKAFFQLSKREAETHKTAMNPFVGKAERQLERLGRLIEDLLDVSKINAGKMIYNKEDFDFGQLLTDMVESIQQTTAAHQIELRNHQSIIYHGDQHRIEQVVINLLNNAIKYSPGEEKVILQCELENKNIIVSVQDFGIGIAEEHLKGLFDRFYRVDNSSSRFQGLGLGLFISAEIIKRHGGSFWIESQPGVGSTFYFLLPLSGEQEFYDVTTNQQTYYEGSFIKIHYQPEGKYMDVDWLGYQNYDSVVKGCTIMLDLMKKNNCQLVLNDNTHVKGNWSEAADWGAEVWFPAMAKGGLKKFAWIYSPSTFSRIAAGKSLPSAYDEVQVAFFDNKQEAFNWLMIPLIQPM